jgi:hypothetical protein
MKNGSNAFLDYRRPSLIIVLLLVVFCFPAKAVCGQSQDNDPLLAAKLQFLKGSLERDHKQTQRWWYGWLSGYSVATVAQGAIYFSSENKILKQDMILGAATTILGTAGQFISPFIPNNEYKQFASYPESNHDEQLVKFAAAEKLLFEWSEKERLALTWQNHILSTTVNLCGGLVTWLGFKRTLKDGLINFAINTVVTEAQIWSQPTLAKRQYKKYCRNYLDGAGIYSYQPEITCFIEAKPGGIGLRIIF